MNENRHIGSTFDSFLDADGTREEVHAEARRRVSLLISEAAHRRLPATPEQLDVLVRDVARDPTVILDPALRDQVARERSRGQGGVVPIRLSRDAYAALQDIATRSFVPVGQALEWMLLHHARRADFNEETRSVLRNSERGVEVARFDSAEALSEDLGFDEPGEPR